MGILNIGVQALQASQVALQTAGHNIANVNTPGYSRQRVLLETNGGQFTGGGYIGKGVNIQSIQRNFSAFLTRQATAAGATKSSKASLPPVSASAMGKTARAPTESQSNFVQQHSQVAHEVEKATGIPANFMLGQAGHETGWGRFEIKHKSGDSSHNIFGIKAGPGWTGKVAEVTTTEFVDGVAQKGKARFRAYDSYADAFKDYARMISESPRYAKVKEQASSALAFASGLQKAGYATDPDYAAKLSRVINTTLQIRRAQA